MVQPDAPPMAQLWAGYEDSIVLGRDKPSERFPATKNVSCFKGWVKPPAQPMRCPAAHAGVPGLFDPAAPACPAA